MPSKKKAAHTFAVGQKVEIANQPHLWHAEQQGYIVDRTAFAVLTWWHVETHPDKGHIGLYSDKELIPIKRFRNIK